MSRSDDAPAMAGVGRRPWRQAITAALCVLLLVGCGQTMREGRPVSMLIDPERAGGLPVTDGPSGQRSSAPAPTGQVANTDGGDIDRLALLGVNDIVDFWQHNYADSLPDSFTPVSQLLSYDSTAASSPTTLCGDTRGLVNAFYCPLQDVLAWDRGQMVPVARKYFQDMGVVGLLAHEYGHAVQGMAGLVNILTTSLVREQQADCFAGSYLRWVAEGHSSRFALGTGDGLNHVLAGLIVIRDPISTPGNPVFVVKEHGTAIDRVGAFQIGFDTGPGGCAGIDMNEIKQRRAGLPASMFDSESQQSDQPIDTTTLSTLMELLGRIFTPKNPPKLTTGPSACSGGRPEAPAAYCPTDNTLAVDLPALQKMGTPTDESQIGLPQGDNTALSVVTSRYMLALEHERGVPLDTLQAAMRTACLTGVAQRKMAEPNAVPSGNQLILGAGDLDKAVTGLLLNGEVASDVNGATVPSGFTRILAYRAGLLGDTDTCYRQFP